MDYENIDNDEQEGGFGFPNPISYINNKITNQIRPLPVAVQKLPNISNKTKQIARNAQALAPKVRSESKPNRFVPNIPNTLRPREKPRDDATLLKESEFNKSLIYDTKNLAPFFNGKEYKTFTEKLKSFIDNLVTPKTRTNFYKDSDRMTVLKTLTNIQFSQTFHCSKNMSDTLKHHVDKRILEDDTLKNNLTTEILHNFNRTVTIQNQEVENKILKQIIEIKTKEIANSNYFTHIIKFVFQLLVIYCYPRFLLNIISTKMVDYTITIITKIESLENAEDIQGLMNELIQFAEDPEVDAGQSGGSLNDLINYMKNSIDYKPYVSSLNQVFYKSLICFAVGIDIQKNLTQYKTTIANKLVDYFKDILSIKDKDEDVEVPDQADQEAVDKVREAMEKAEADWENRNKDSSDMKDYDLLMRLISDKQNRLNAADNQSQKDELNHALAALQLDLKNLVSHFTTRDIDHRRWQTLQQQKYIYEKMLVPLVDQIKINKALKLYNNNVNILSIINNIWLFDTMDEHTMHKYNYTEHIDFFILKGIFNSNIFKPNDKDYTIEDLKVPQGYDDTLLVPEIAQAQILPPQIADPNADPNAAGQLNLAVDGLAAPQGADPNAAAPLHVGVQPAAAAQAQILPPQPADPNAGVDGVAAPLGAHDYLQIDNQQAALNALPEPDSGGKRITRRHKKRAGTRRYKKRAGTRRHKKRSGTHRKRKNRTR